MADRYEIKGRIGRGGIGAVYQAYDNLLGREVAIKRLLPLEDTNLNDAVDDSLQHEAKSLAKLSHPNIVTIFEFGDDAKGPFVAFELLDGETFKDLIAEGALSESDFFGVADQILDALVAAHEIDILHRDIKPANIMLSWLPSGKFQLKILDFGLSKLSQKPSKQTTDQKGTFLGSIDYIAPEQLELKPLDARTDLYSLGCVLYFGLTQRPPFSGESFAETSRNHVNGKVVPLYELRPDLSIDVCNWVMRLIATKPENRPHSALTALDELQQVRIVLNNHEYKQVELEKTVIPVVQTANRTNQARVLEHTQQIIAQKPPPMMVPVVPPHPVIQPQELETQRRRANFGLIFGLVGLVAAIVMGWLLYQTIQQQSDAQLDGSVKAAAS